MSGDKKMAGYLQLKNADVRWFLSVDGADLPASAVDSGRPTYRCITIDGQEIEFSDGFTDLHTAVYRDILAGRGYGIAEARPSIELAYDIRGADVSTSGQEKVHPLALKII